MTPTHASRSRRQWADEQAIRRDQTRDQVREGRDQAREAAAGSKALTNAAALPDSARPDELERLAAMPAEGAWHVGGERGDDLKLTNLDKVLFEPPPGDPGAAPVTKRELIGYFARIAPTMLPHLAERPLNLQRFPNGAARPELLAEGHPGARRRPGSAAGTRSGSTTARRTTT